MSSTGTPDPAPPQEAELDLTTVIVKTHAPRKAGDEDRAHYLVVVEGPERGLRIELGKKAVTFGRTEPADVVLPDPQVSRSHCRVGLVMDDVFLSDLGSSNGTFVDNERISKTTPLPVGGRFRIGSRVLEHEFRARKEVQASKALDTDLENAGSYVRSLLPPPIADGPIRTEWLLLPSARLGGDVFGYRYLDPDRFAIYLLDVSGHGTGPAMHAVSVVNVLRGGAMPGIDPGEPAHVVASLNSMFQMRSHGGLYLTIWYGVYNLASRSLDYCSAGHHPSFLVPPGREEAIALRLPNVPIGLTQTARFRAGHVEVPPGSSLYVFSDGVFEVDTRAGGLWTLEDLAARILEAPAPGVPETQRLLDAVRSIALEPAFEDDFTLLVASFA
jgi:serine phosphatase RsbU (regulator of sigma subunit)